MPLQDTFWGDRYAILRDPFGHRWSIAAPIEDLSPRELQGRAAEWAAEQRESWARFAGALGAILKTS